MTVTESFGHLFLFCSLPLALSLCLHLERSLLLDLVRNQLLRLVVLQHLVVVGHLAVGVPLVLSLHLVQLHHKPLGQLPPQPLVKALEPLVQLQHLEEVEEVGGLVLFVFLQ